MSARSSIGRLALVALLTLASSCSRTSGDATGSGSGGGGGGGSGTGPGAEKPPLKVAAAADLAKAFGELGAAYEKEHGQKVVFSFGSTGLLAKQIEEGAPFDLFAAANVSFVDEAVKSGACSDATKALYARGRIVAWTKDGDAPRMADLAAPRWAKIAIANPEHAPYGRAAKEAMQKAGVWDAVASRVVYGENVQQTLQFAQSGNADVAIVALSLAVVSGGKYAPVDPAMHAPLEQALVVCKGGPGAREFAAYVNADAGRSVMRRYGFLLPGETISAAGAAR